MEPIEALKLRAAMKNHQLKNHHHPLSIFIPYLLTALTCSLFCSYPFWLPSIEHFLFVTLPHVGTSLLSPKSLFLVVNAIVAFLLGESKLGRLHSPATSHDEIYEEYVERSRTRKMLSTCPGSESSRELESERLTGDEAREEEEESEKESGDDDDDDDDKHEAEPEQEEEDDNDDDDDDDKQEAEPEQQEEDDDDDDDKQEAEPEQEEEDDDDEETDERSVQEEDGIPAEELKKRVEEFIARVNKQRWLEARSLMCVR